MFKNNQAKKLTIGIVGTIFTLVAGFNSSTLAQSNDDNGYQSNEKDSLYGDAPGGLNPLDLMHRAQQLNQRSAAEFGRESQSQIDSSVSDFKRLQQQRMLEQQQPGATSAEQTESVEVVK